MLDESVPADFQKILGTNYPIVDSRETATINFGEVDGRVSPVSRRVIYDFSTLDNSYTISLCSDFIAIKTEKYERWERILNHIEVATEALLACYIIPHFSRVGLRYVNVIDKRALNLESTSWKDLVRASALGLLGDDEVRPNDICEQSATTILSLSQGRVAVRSGVAISDGEKYHKFVIDSDFFSESPAQSEADASRLLAYYNKSARNAFRWFIQERLHQALEPGGIE